MENLQKLKPNKIGMLKDAIRYSFSTIIHEYPTVFSAAIIAFVTFGIAGIILATLVVFSLKGILSELAMKGETTLGLLPTSIIAVISTIALYSISLAGFIGWLRFVFQLHDQKKADIKTVFSGFFYLSTSIMLSILLGAIIVVSLLLFVVVLHLLPWSKMVAYSFSIVAIIAFLYYFLRISYSWYIVADSYPSAWQALKTSWHITRGYVLLFILLMICTALPATVTRIIGSIIGSYSELLEPIMHCIIWLVSVICSMAEILASVRLYRLLQRIQIGHNEQQAMTDA